MIPLTYEEIWRDFTPRNYSTALNEAIAAITALWQKEKKGLFGSSFPNGWYFDEETLQILGAASAIMACSEGSMSWIISKAYQLNQGKPYFDKIDHLLTSTRAAIKITINFRQIDVGSKYYIRGGGEYKKIPASEISGRQLTEWVKAYQVLCEIRSTKYKQLLAEYPEIEQITR